jgi:ferric-dicitrate binding protein FerR (iron transport regulator)
LFICKAGDVQVIGVNTDTYTSWKENMLRFNDTPLEEALKEL